MGVTASDRETSLLLGSAAPRSGRAARSVRRRTRILVIIVAALLVVDYGISVALETGWLHRSLTLKLEAAFGRSVEVSNFSFSLLEGPGSRPIM